MSTPSAMGPAGEPQRFRLARKLGSGGMGVVYEALDHATGARVGLKTLHRQDPSLLLDLKREFRAMQGIVHPNLVRLGDLFQADDGWFFTMELVEGDDYLAWLRRDPPCGALASSSRLSDASTLRLADAAAVAVAPEPARAAQVERLRRSLPQLAAALSALHTAGLVHGDVKPSNIVITPEGRLVLLDFGLIRSIAVDDHQSRRAAGTLAYMAPEQADAGPITAAADCYAVGVILYQALTGRLPFVGSLADVVHQKRSGSPVEPRRIARGVPRDLEDLSLELLSAEPSARPTVGDIERRICAPARPTPDPPPPPARALFGRDAELARILGAVADSAGRPAVVLVDGPSGIGKTSLVMEAARRIGRAATDALVLCGRCFEREVVAYPGVDMVVDALASALGRAPPEDRAFVVPRYAALLRQLFPVLDSVPELAAVTASGPVAGHEARVRAQAALHELFARTALRHRLVLVIDDAQWLTEDSRGLLAALLRRDDPVPLVLVLSSRSESRSELAAWARALGCPAIELSLGPLPRRDCVALLRQYHLHADSDRLEAMAADSGGYPLFLHELARATGEGAEVAFDRLDDCLRDRARRLSAVHIDVLRLVCAGARPITRRVIGAAAAVDPTEVDHVIGDLAYQRLVVSEGAAPDGLVQTMHDRIRTALLHELDDPGRRDLHRRLADAIERSDPEDVEALANHWSEAGAAERAGRFARRAAEHAVASLAFERALVLYELALRGTPAASEQRGTLLAARGDALANLGRSADAAASYLEATQHCPLGQVDELVQRGADQLIRSGRVDDGKQLLSRVLDRLALRLPRSRRAAAGSLVLGRLMLALRGSRPARLSDARRAWQLRRIDACWSAGDLLLLVDPLGAAALHTQGLRLAFAGGEPFRLARALGSDAVLEAMPGARSRSRAFHRLAQARRLADTVARPALDGWLMICEGVTNLQLGAFHAAQRAFDAAEAVFERRCVGAFFEAGNARELALWTLAYRGELELLSDRLPRALELATALDNKLAVLKLRCGPTHVAQLAADEPHQLLASCDADLVGLVPERYPFPYLCTLFARVRALIYLGRAGDALATIDAARGGIRRAGLLHVQFFRVDVTSLHAFAALAALAARRAEPRQLTALVTRAVRRLRGERVAWATALAAAIEASLATLTLLPGQAAQSLVAAADQLAECGLGLHASAMRHQAARWCRSTGRAVSGADHWADHPLIANPDALAQSITPLPICG